MNNNSELIKIIEMIAIAICTYYSNFKIANIKLRLSIVEISKVSLIIIFAILCGILKYKVNYATLIISLAFIISLMFFKSNIGKSIIITIISLSINYLVLMIIIIIVFLGNKILNVNNDIFSLTIILLGYIILLNKMLKIKKFKHGVTFLKNDIQSNYIDTLVINISIVVLLCISILGNTRNEIANNISFVFIIVSIMMFITIQKSLQLYYKQKLLVQELEETKKELENKKEELQNVEKENINISKKNHTLAHKQKSLEHKIEEMINKSEVSKEEAEELKSRLKEIGKDLYKEKETIELDKTGIPEIDDMMKYMQSECKKNKIEFEYQLKGNIYYMTNNLVSKEDLETLLADHIKNAIIAINHTNNLNRSILVRLGKIDENYGLYIYDSGIEFKPEIFEKLGKEPSTTHPDEGGTGMGFMNTFDTLRKYNASLTIEEYDKPNKDNYTKVLIIKFDGKKEFKIKSYQLKETIKIG